MRYTFQTSEEHEARDLLNAANLSGEVDEFLEFLMRYDKHRDLTPEAEKVLEDIRAVALHLKGF